MVYHSKLIPFRYPTDESSICYFKFRDILPDKVFRYEKKFFIKTAQTQGKMYSAKNGWTSLNMVEFYLLNDFVAIPK